MQQTLRGTTWDKEKKHGSWVCFLLDSVPQVDPSNGSLVSMLLFHTDIFLLLVGLAFKMWIPQASVFGASPVRREPCHVLGCSECSLPVPIIINHRSYSTLRLLGGKEVGRGWKAKQVQCSVCVCLCMRTCVYLQSIIFSDTTPLPLLVLGCKSYCHMLNCLLNNDY